MAITNDEYVFTEGNDFSSQGDFSDPVDNNNSSQPAIFIRDTDSVCDQFELKKDATGNFETTFTSHNVTNRTVVGTFMLFGADVDNVPVNTIQMAWGSSGNLNSNYEYRDTLANDVDAAGGWIISKACGDDALTTGSPSYTGITRAGWRLATGGNNDGKLCGADKMLSIEYIQGNAQTVTLANLVTESDDERLFVAESIATFYKFECNIRLGGSGTTTFAPNGDTIYFNNLADSQERKFDIITGGTATNFSLTNCSVFWNSGQTSTHDSFAGASNAAEFKLNGNSITAYGTINLPTFSSGNTEVNNNTFSSGEGKIIVEDQEFEGNTISGAADGVEYAVADTNRMVGNSYVNCTNALVITGTGNPTITLDGDTFSGNTNDIRWEGTGTLTVNQTNGANASTSSTPNGGTVLFPSSVNITLTNVVSGTTSQFDGVFTCTADAGTVNGSGDSILEVTASIPSNFASTGTVRVFTGSFYEKYSYTAISGAQITISGTLSQSFGGARLLLPIQAPATISTDPYTVTTAANQDFEVLLANASGGTVYQPVLFSDNSGTGFSRRIQQIED